MATSRKQKIQRQLTKKSNMKQILAEKDSEGTEQRLLDAIEMVMSDIDINDYCKENALKGITNNDFELVTEALHLCEAFNWYPCNGFKPGGTCPMFKDKQKLEDITDLKHISECKLFKK